MAKELKDIRGDVEPGMIVRVHQRIKETNTKGRHAKRNNVKPLTTPHRKVKTFF